MELASQRTARGTVARQPCDAQVAVQLLQNLDVPFVVAQSLGRGDVRAAGDGFKRRPRTNCRDCLWLEICVLAEGALRCVDEHNHMALAISPDIQPMYTTNQL